MSDTFRANTAPFSVPLPGFLWSTSIDNRTTFTWPATSDYPGSRITVTRMSDGQVVPVQVVATNAFSDAPPPPQAQPAPRDTLPGATAEFVPTGEDITILAILAEAGRALTFREIIAESLRLEQQDRKRFRRLSDRMVRDRAGILLSHRLAERPPDTKKKGIGITTAGRNVLIFAAAKLPQTRRKN
jgi:hypothetical protein